MAVLTSSRCYLWRRHLDSKMAAPEMTSTKAWGELFDPYCGGGGKWRPFRFRSQSWMTSFPVPQVRSSKMATESGRAAIFLHLHNRDRKTPPRAMEYGNIDDTDIMLLCNNSVSAYFMLYDASHTYIRGVILWYISIILRVFISRITMDPTHSCGELFYDITQIPRDCWSHVAKWLSHTVQYCPIDNECMHLLSHCRGNKGILPMI